MLKGSKISSFQNKGLQLSKKGRRGYNTDPRQKELRSATIVDPYIGEDIDEETIQTFTKVVNTTFTICNYRNQAEGKTQIK